MISRSTSDSRSDRPSIAQGQQGDSGGGLVALDATYISSSSCNGRLIHFFQVVSSGLSRVGPAGVSPRPRVAVVVDAVMFDASASQQLFAQRIFDVSRCKVLRMALREASLLARPAPTSVLDTLVEQLPFVDLIRCIAAVFRPEHSSAEPSTPVYAASGTKALRRISRGAAGSPQKPGGGDDGDAVVVFDCELDNLALTSIEVDDRRSIADLRQKTMLIEEMRLSHAAEVARLHRDMQNEKEASLLELVKLHSEKEQLMERLAVLEFRQTAAQDASGERQPRGTSSANKHASYLAGADDVSSVGELEQRGRMEVSTMSSGLPPAVGLQYWTAYTSEAARLRAIPQ